MRNPFDLGSGDLHWVDRMCLLTLADDADACDQELREQPFNKFNAYILYRAYKTGVFKSDLLVSLVDQPDRVGIPTGNVRIQGDMHKHQIAFPDGMSYIPDYELCPVGDSL
tara:strand:- start:43 stop:375 length:333 start_codon:yes stop_codon:yes gene_type:complete